MSVLTGGNIYSYHENKLILLDTIISQSQMKAAFEDVFNELDVNHFLIEDDYVDQDFLIDYSNYYVSCYHSYERFCKRIHFFTETAGFKITKRQLTTVLTKGSEEEILDFTRKINQIYLGFMVIRPFDRRRIGRTCLKLSEFKLKNRFVLTRTYVANLYGIPLTVESFAFQEQDEATAACASIALWSTFNYTGKRFQHAIPSPSEVTKLALSEASHAKKFPNKGLSTEQMAVAITKIGLIPSIINTSDERTLKSHIYAYLKANIPLICGLSVYDITKDGNVILGTKTFHAVTIGGYSFESALQRDSLDDEICLYSDRLNSFYVHDDQLRPFAKMDFHTTYILFEENMPIIPIKTSWEASKYSNKKNRRYAKIESLIIPSESIIRKTLNDIILEVSVIEKFYHRGTDLVDEEKILPKQVLEWDIFLTEINELKASILLSDKTVYGGKQIFLQQKFPKYLWRARATGRAGDLFEILIDATDTKNGHSPITAVCYEKIPYEIFSHFRNKNQKLKS